MGNEQAGLTEEMAAACEARVKIPMVGRADSLNLAYKWTCSLELSAKTAFIAQQAGKI